MNEIKKCRQISNSLYNVGLERAKIRDLTGAAEYLKKSLHFYKYQTDARNLLGLIYYEMGEVSDALMQWVISMNLQENKNPAEHFLEEVQGKPGKLETSAQTISKYNQALMHAQGGSDDLAVLQLKKVVDMNPNFVKAHLLLALLYMAREDYVKAGKSLYRVLQIDKQNPKAQWYMSLVKVNTGKAEIEKKKLKNAFSHREMQDDDIIIPPTYKENTGWQSVLNIAAGLLIGLFAISFLILPYRTKALNNAHNQEILSYSEKLNAKSLEIDQLNVKMQTLQTEHDVAVDQLNSQQSADQSLVSQYQTLIGILQAYRKDQFTNAVTLYAVLDQSLITDPDVQAIVAEVKADMDANGYQVLEKLGDTSNEAGDYPTALDYYNKSLIIHPDNPQVIFNMAVIYGKLEQMDQANDLYGQVIMNYPNTDLAAQAKAARGY